MGVCPVHNDDSSAEHDAMTVSKPQPAAPYPKLRWYQFRLRSLFILTLLVAIGMSYVTVTMRDCRKQKAAAEAIERTGGWVESEPTWLGRLLRDDSLLRVTKITRFSWERGTDDVWVHLQGLSQLQELSLGNANITDAGMIYLRGLSQLQTLRLDDTKVTDAGLVHLRGLSQLQTLNLYNTSVTDAGLVYLRGLSQLRILVLNSTRVTDQGVKKLQQALPNCKIEH